MARTVPEQEAHRSSSRARRSLGAVVGGYFLLAVIAGASNSPLTQPLPAGAHPPAWARDVARWLGMDRVGRPALIVVSLLVVAGVVAAFVVLVGEAWRGRVRLAAAAAGAAIALAIAVAAPLLLSKDATSYAAYGRIFAVHHANPYAVVPASFPGDPFVRATAGQWQHVRSPYGPGFTLLSAAIVRGWAGSPGMVLFMFKVATGLAVAIAVACAAVAARAVRPDRAAAAVILVGLNPVMVIHTVGGGHVDALISAPLAGALAVAGTRRRRRKCFARVRSAAVTALLALACLIKPVVVPGLALWIWWDARAEAEGQRSATALVHVGLAALLAAVALVPFLDGWRTFRPLLSLGGVEAWASPSHLVARPIRAIVAGLGGAAAGSAATKVVLGAFLAGYLWLLWRLARDPRSSQRAPAEGWATALLLLALSLPYLLPWYAAWFVPFLALVDDEAVAGVGVAASAVLALTLIPADPFRGFTSWGEMLWVHYGAAAIMLALLTVLARAVSRRGPSRPPEAA